MSEIQVIKPTIEVVDTKKKYVVVVVSEHYDFKTIQAENPADAVEKIKQGFGRPGGTKSRIMRFDVLEKNQKGKPVHSENRPVLFDGRGGIV